MTLLTAAVCTYNRAGRLHKLISELRRQECPVQFEILVINNNSSDDTENVLEELSRKEGVHLRYVNEPQQGIVYARNRAIEEAVSSEYIFFMDDDELPQPGLLKSVVHALVEEKADCAGGRISVLFEGDSRPAWLGGDLLGFLGEFEHGGDAFWINSELTPVWTGNVAYRMSLFSSGLRFDPRYNRVGTDVGGGEDYKMFRILLEKKLKIRYRPDMAVNHLIETDKLKKSYFIILHYRAGKRYGRYEMESSYPKSWFGVPMFMVGQMLRQCFKTIGMFIKNDPGLIRQSMNMVHAGGAIVGRYHCWRDDRG